MTELELAAESEEAATSDSSVPDALCDNNKPSDHNLSNSIPAPSLQLPTSSLDEETKCAEDGASSDCNDQASLVSESEEIVPAFSKETSSSIPVAPKTVTFSPTCTVHTHKVILGDSPTCPILPLTLDWERAEPREVNLQQFESSLLRRKSRQRGARKLLYYEREKVLLTVGGYSASELYRAKAVALNELSRIE